MSSDDESFECQMLDLKAEEVKLLDPFRCSYFFLLQTQFNLILYRDDPEALPEELQNVNIADAGTPMPSEGWFI